MYHSRQCFVYESFLTIRVFSYYKKSASRFQIEMRLYFLIYRRHYISKFASFAADRLGLADK